MSATPVQELNGMDLCDRVARAMGWTMACYSGGGAWYKNPHGGNRYVGDHGVNSKQAFNPVADGNDLAEVIAEIERRGWGWQISWGTSLDYQWARVAGISSAGTAFGVSFSVALLRAFALACERMEKESGG